MNSFEVACHSIYEIANERRLEHQRAVVGVCGLGGSGKSTICRQVAKSASFPCTVFELDWYLTHFSQDRRDAILRSLAGVEANLDFWRDPTNWYDKVVFLEAPAHAALGRSARRDSHRNPEAYQAFKASVTISFDLPYFAKNRAAGDNLVLT